jgi:hypothetical protein
MLLGSRDVDAYRHFGLNAGSGKASIARHGGHFEDSGVFGATLRALDIVNFSAVTS